MKKDEKLQLIHLAAKTNWTTQGELLKAEDTYIQNYEVFLIKDLNDIIRRYLSLGSIPYAIGEHDENELKEKLHLLWPSDWLNKEQFHFTRENERLPSLPTGNMHPTIMFIGDAPGIGWSPPAFDRTLSYGPSSHMLRKALLAENIFYRCWFTNLSKSSILHNEPTLTSDILKYKENLELEIALLQPKYIILLGRHVEQKFHEHFSERNVVQVYHPSYVSRIGMSPKEYGGMIRQAILASKVKHNEEP